MIVRKARPEDAAAIAGIQNPIIRDTAITFNSRERTVQEISNAISELPCFLVAEMEERVVGFVSYDQFRKGPGYSRCMEHTIVLRPEAHGRGVGRALMSAAETGARAAGVGSLWAGVSGENPAGVAFHTRIGYAEVVRLPKVGFKFGRWMDLVLMRKWLLDDE
ncbi:N-acetyltransferase family protein [Silicimonas sp. MF1-12-2]|uniref:GNAT family N-acetyltransferase n=1 Tax=Silicimonas sp. MF1-12-2 TaxID=3384793 RepID=UPI0039B5E205